jgi:hypothetical protein
VSLETGGAFGVAVLAGVALAAAAGLRAFLPLLVLALAARMGVVDLHENATFLASDLALIGLVVATVLEIAGDKVPFVDHALDVIGTVVRPGAGFLAGMVLLADFHPALATGISLLLGAISLGTHLGHAKARVGSTVLTAGAGNPVISTFEDVVAGVLSVVAVLLPVVAVVLALVMTALVWRMLFRRRDHGKSAPRGRG